MWHDAAVDFLTLIIIIRMQIYRDGRFRGYLFRAPSNENRQVRKMSRDGKGGSSKMSKVAGLDWTVRLPTFSVDERSEASYLLRIRFPVSITRISSQSLYAPVAWRPGGIPGLILNVS